MKEINKLITIPLRDFAVPAPRIGSIEAHSGYSRSAADGQEIHVRVQKQRAKSDPSYQSEVPVSCLFERGGYSFRVQGGSFSEGMDYAGEMVIGAFVVGPPLPTFDLEREQMRSYYQQKYGAGFDYAYTIPAMAKAVQAAGRVIRSETDKGLVVLMDRRFLDPGYSQSMPADWFGSDVTEIVSERILSDVADFWAA